MNRGKRKEIPLSSTYGITISVETIIRLDYKLTKPCAAMYTGLRVKSAVKTSNTTFGSNHTSGGFDMSA